MNFSFPQRKRPPRRLPQAERLGRRRGSKVEAFFGKVPLPPPKAYRQAYRRSIQRHAEREREIQRRDDQPYLKRKERIRDQHLRLHGEIRHGDGADERGVLDERNKLAGQRRQHPAHGLRQDNEPERVPYAEAEADARFPLRPGHGLQARPEQFRHVRPLEQAEGQHGRAERPHADGGSEQKIHKKQLKEQRGISQTPHIDMRHAPRHRPRGKPQQRRAEPGGDGKGKPEKRDTHGHAEPVEQRAGDEMPVRPAPQIPPDAIPLPVIGNAVRSGKHRAEQPDADQEKAYSYGMASHPPQQPGRRVKPHAASPFAHRACPHPAMASKTAFAVSETSMSPAATRQVAH